MKPTWKTELPLIILLAAMVVLAAASWGGAPDRIPTHWNLRGEVDGYGGKATGLLLMPAMGIGVYLLMLFLPRIDPGRANYERFTGAYYVIRASVIGFLAIFYGFTHLWMRGVHLDANKFVGVTVGALLILLGNLFGKIRPNWFVGMRTPWTLSSKRAWTRTHRLAGWVLIAGGSAIMAAGIFGSGVAVIVSIVVMAGGLGWATVYSYLVWRKDPDRIHPAGTSPGNSGEV